MFSMAYKNQSDTHTKISQTPTKSNEYKYVIQSFCVMWNSIQDTKISPHIDLLFAAFCGPILIPDGVKALRVLRPLETLLPSSLSLESKGDRISLSFLAETLTLIGTAGELVPRGVARFFSPFH